jgi:hypothetical protein
MRTRVVVLTATALAAAVLAGGCTGGTGEPGSTPSPSGGDVTATPQPPVESPPPESPEPFSPPPRVKPEPTVTAGELSLTGDVVEGVEAGCRLLRTPSGDYLLVVRPEVDGPLLRPGNRVTVRGRLEPELLSYCQQGTPFVVTAASRA